MPQDKRSDPEALLKSINKLEQQKNRGSLRIFFGMCPGVGKTYAMLKAAIEQKKNGLKIYIGTIDTHKRVETEILTKELPIIPKKKIHYRDHILEEMNIDEILELKPDLVLVDELAHSNAPGSRHSKRYQDVEEILNNGINVYTTINVQHIESRVDLVQQITGVVVRETVPDSFLEIADQIELIDLSPIQLLKRLNEGKVYLGENADRAKLNFFKEEHLIALRELALRFTAEKVDHELQEQMLVKQIAGPWNTNERLLVAISHSPYSQRLLRATRRMSYNLEAPWIALYVDSGHRLKKEDYETLQKNMTLASKLGAEVVTTLDSDIPNAIRRIAEERNITQIIMGRPDQRFFKDLMARGTLLDQLVRETSNVDVHVIRQDRKPRYQGFYLPSPKFQSKAIEYIYTLFFMIFITLIGKIIVPFIGYKTVGFFFLLGVLLISTVANRGPIIMAAFFSATVWNFAFIPPIFTFAITSHEDLTMCFTYFIVASVAGVLTTRIRNQKKLLLIREERANTLYQLSKKFSETKNIESVFEATSQCIEKNFRAKINIWISDENEKLGIESGFTSINDNLEKDFAVASWTFDNKEKAGWSTDTLAGSRCLSLPLIGKNKIIGVLLFYPNQIRTLSFEQEAFLKTIIDQLAITLEREILDKKTESTRMLEQSEKLHQILLNSVSHELRTPLTSIIGNSTALQDELTIQNSKYRNVLIQELVGSTKRLNHVVENLLDMSRINSGTLQLSKEWFEVNDLINETIQNIKTNTITHSILFNSESSPIYYNGDYKLLEHALNNLILNACHYSKPQNPITIKLMADQTKWIVSITDLGMGIPKESLPLIFNKFYRIPGSPTGGMGLGLSIVKNIVELHQGTISVSSEGINLGTTMTLEFERQYIPSHILES